MTRAKRAGSNLRRRAMLINVCHVAMVLSSAMMGALGVAAGHTHTSARPLAVRFDCSTSTPHSGPSSRLAASSACAASSTLLTTINTRPAGLSTALDVGARGWGWVRRGMRDMNMVVLPLPVGDETPMRVRPEARAERHASMAECWYGRSESGGDEGEGRLIGSRGGVSVELEAAAAVAVRRTHLKLRRHRVQGTSLDALFSIGWCYRAMRIV